MALHIAGAWFHMVAASDDGVKFRSVSWPRSGALDPPRPFTLWHCAHERVAKSSAPRVESAVKTGV